MARIKFKGLEEYELKLSKMISSDMKKIADKALVAGAAIVADEVKSRLTKLKSVPHYEAMNAAKKRNPTYLTNREKQGLIDSFGITKPGYDKQGFYNVKLGFDGYNDVKTKKFPGGQPNQLIARACESGSSAMIKQPFMRTAISASKKEAEQKMISILEKEFENWGK